MTASTLDALLLFLTSHKGQSGYDLRRLFLSSPIGLFSDSPGAIYPALKRLEGRGWLTGLLEAGGRRRTVYALTAEGRAALAAWLAAPIDAHAAARRPAELELRYVIAAQVLGPVEALSFLRDCEAFYAGQAEGLEAFLAGPGKALGPPSRAANELGLKLTRVRRDWCREQIVELEGKIHETQVDGR